MAALAQRKCMGQVTKGLLYQGKEFGVVFSERRETRMVFRRQVTRGAGRRHRSAEWGGEVGGEVIRRPCRLFG